jgi:hypothetical protein
MPNKVNIEEVNSLIEGCRTQIEGIKELIWEFHSEAQAIAYQRLKTVNNRLRMEMLNISQTSETEAVEEEFSLLGQVLHNLQLIVGNKRLNNVHKGFFITALSNMMEEFMSYSDWGSQIQNPQKFGGYLLGYLQLDSFKKWSTAAVTDLGKHGIMVMHSPERNEWEIHALGENSLRETIGMYGFDEVELDEFVEIFKSLIKEGLGGHINYIEDWSFGSMSEEDTEHLLKERLETIDGYLDNIENFARNFPESLPKDTIKRLKRLNYRLELELYSIAGLEAGTGGKFECGDSLVEQLIDNTRFVLDETNITNEEKLTLIATFSNIMLEFIDSAKFAEKIINFQNAGNSVQGYLKFDSIINWCNARGASIGNYGLMMTYMPDENTWHMHALGDMVLRDAIDSYAMSDVNFEIMLDKVKSFLIIGLEKKKRTVQKRLKELKVL